MRLPCCLFACVFPPINFRTPEPIFMKFGTYITTPEPISMAQLKNPTHQSVRLYVYPLLVARQRLGTNFTEVTNSQVTIEELLDASFSMRSVSYQDK
jgi:hypothetical protein